VIRRRWPRVGSIALVTWDDATFAWRDTHNDDGDDEYLVETLGWIIKRTRRALWIAGERLPDGVEDRWRGVTRIPIGMVREIVRIA
jgi:hypothetical protein